VAQKYGFSSRTSQPRTRDGIDLWTIKKHRNDLAHGCKSFNDIGRDRSATELFKIKNRVIIYLKEILINIDRYIERQEYLAR
jgi:hypothetical protein